jgi:hypothetical protein
MGAQWLQAVGFPERCRLRARSILDSSSPKRFSRGGFMNVLSSAWGRVGVLMSAMAIVSLAFLVGGFPWTAPAWAGLLAFTAVSAVLWMRMKSTPTLAQVIEHSRATHSSGAKYRKDITDGEEVLLLR